MKWNLYSEVPLCLSKRQVASWVVKQSIYAATFQGFSKADEIGMQANPERGTLQQTSLGLEDESNVSASRFLLPTVYPWGGTQLLINLNSNGATLEVFLMD